MRMVHYLVLQHGSDKEENDPRFNQNELSGMQLFLHHYGFNMGSIMCHVASILMASKFKLWCASSNFDRHHCGRTFSLSTEPFLWPITRRQILLLKRKLSSLSLISILPVLCKEVKDDNADALQYTVLRNSRAFRTVFTKMDYLCHSIGFFGPSFVVLHSINFSTLFGLLCMLTSTNVHLLQSRNLPPHLSPYAARQHLFQIWNE